MKLEKYNKKRNFNNTTEPVGKVKKSKILRFVVQYHRATTDHYDFRLEYDGVLLSWAVPKGLSLNPNVKRLAVMVEDHPIDYINFEGIIPKGNYGAGSVEIFDNGKYKIIEDFEKGLKKGHLKFILNGKIFKGEWSLVKTDEKNWLMIKSKDEFSTTKEKAKTKRTNPFKSCNVQLATLTDKIPTGKNWIFEIKYDGYRMLSFVESNKIKLLTRNQQNYTTKFASIVNSLKELTKDIPFVLDGEIVCFDKNGKSNFSLLQESIKNESNNFSYVVFDILSYNGKDLRKEMLKTRKEYLENLLSNCPKNIIYSTFVVGSGKQTFNLAKKLNLEGIVAKNLNSTYSGTRNKDWLKIKCYKRQEFVIIGYTTTEKNEKLSAILVGYYKNKNLIYAGKVGTGFTERKRQELNKLFKDYIIKKCPLKKELNLKDNINYLKPKLVAEIQYAEFTKENLLRQPSFIDLRFDKKVTQVVLEKENDK